MSAAAIACPQCKGAGHVMVPGSATSLTATPPPAAKENCGGCHGTGIGRDATTTNLEAYLTGPFPEADEIFTLAKQIASSTRTSKARDTVTERVSVQHGLFGRKSRMEDVTREVQQDYWLLATKGGFIKRTGDRCERGGAMEEEETLETRFCLGRDGSFMVFSRRRESAVWKETYKYTEMEWSAWEAVPLTGLAHFAADFDFEGYWRQEMEGYTHVDHCVGPALRHVDHFGVSVYLRQVYPKGAGLLQAVAGLQA